MHERGIPSTEFTKLYGCHFWRRHVISERTTHSRVELAAPYFFTALAFTALAFTTLYLCTTLAADYSFTAWTAAETRVATRTKSFRTATLTATKQDNKVSIEYRIGWQALGQKGHFNGYLCV